MPLFIGKEYLFLTYLVVLNIKIGKSHCLKCLESGMISGRSSGLPDGVISWRL